MIYVDHDSVKVSVGCSSIRLELDNAQTRQGKALARRPSMSVLGSLTSTPSCGYIVCLLSRLHATGCWPFRHITNAQNRNRVFPGSRCKLKLPFTKEREVWTNTRLTRYHSSRKASRLEFLLEHLMKNTILWTDEEFRLQRFQGSSKTVKIRPKVQVSMAKSLPLQHHFNRLLEYQSAIPQARPKLLQLLDILYRHKDMSCVGFLA